MSVKMSVVKKNEGPKGLRVGRIVMYRGQRGKVSSIIPSSKAKIVLTESKEELLVFLKDLSYPRKGAKATKIGTVESASKSGKILAKKSTAGAKSVPSKPLVKKAIKPEAPKPLVKKAIKPEAPKEKGQSKKKMYKIIRPDYVVFGFTDIAEPEDRVYGFIDALKEERIDLAFVDLGEGSGMANYEKVQKKLDGNLKKYAHLKRAINDFRDPAISEIVIPSINNDLFAFDLTGSRGNYLYTLLDAAAAYFGQDATNVIFTLPLYDDEDDHLIHNVLILGY